MIHHVSISAREPRHVAEVLAEIMHGSCHPFPGQIAEFFMAVSGDEHGTMVEVYPEDTTLQPGQRDDQQVTGLRGQTAPATVPFHFLLSVPATAEEIERIGTREGWRTRLFGRGPRRAEAILPRHRVLGGEPADDRTGARHDDRRIHRRNGVRGI